MRTARTEPYGRSLPDKDPMDRDPPRQKSPGQRPCGLRTPWTETLGQRPLWTETPLDSDSPGQRPPGQRLFRHRLPDRDPLWQRPPRTQTPLDRDPWTEIPWTETPWTETLLTETPPMGQSKKKSFNFYCKVMWNSTIDLKKLDFHNTFIFFVLWGSLTNFWIFYYKYNWFT